jgi:hypothetical protein
MMAWPAAAVVPQRPAMRPIAANAPNSANICAPMVRVLMRNYYKTFYCSASRQLKGCTHSQGVSDWLHETYRLS